MASIFELLGNIAINNAEANEQIDETTEKAGGLGDALKGGIKTAAKFGVGVAAGVTTAAAGMYKMASNTAQVTDKIDKMSQKIGISRESYQELDFILSQSGTSVDNLQAGMKTLVSAMDGAASGTKTNVEQFQRLGVSVTDANGNLRSSEDVLFETLTALQGMENQTEKTRLATELFGKSGTELMPLLNGAAGSIDEMKQQAHDLGLVLSDEVIDGGVHLTDTIDQCQRGFSAIATNIGGFVLPVVQQALGWVVDHMEDIRTVIANVINGIAFAWENFGQPIFNAVIAAVSAVADFVITNMPYVQQFISDCITVIENIWNQYGKPVWDAFVSGISSVVTFVEEQIPNIQQFISDCFTGIQTLWTEYGQPVWETLSGFISSIFTAAEENFPAIQQFVFDCFTGISDFWTNTLEPVFTAICDFITNTLFSVFQADFEGMKTLAESVFTGIKDTWETHLQPCFEAIQTVVENVFNAIVGFWDNTLKPCFDGILTFICDTFGITFEDTFDGENGIASFVTNGFNKIITAWETILKPLLDGIIDFITNVLSGDWETAWNGLVETFGTVFSGIIDLCKTPINAVIGLINGMIGGIESGLNWIIGGVNSIGFTVPDWVPGIGGEGWHISIPTIAWGRIPELESGGVLKKGQVGLLEGKGDEAVVPLSRNTEWLDRIAERLTVLQAQQQPQPAQQDDKALIKKLEEVVEAIKAMKIYLDKETIVGEIAPDMDEQLGYIYAGRERGL